jgi:hypothetical protein
MEGPQLFEVPLGGTIMKQQVLLHIYINIYIHMYTHACLHALIDIYIHG